MVILSFCSSNVNKWSWLLNQIPTRANVAPFSILFPVVAKTRRHCSGTGHLKYWPWTKIKLGGDQNQYGNLNCSFPWKILINTLKCKKKKKKNTPVSTYKSSILQITGFYTFYLLVFHFHQAKYQKTDHRAQVYNVQQCVFNSLFLAECACNTY